MEVPAPPEMRRRHLVGWFLLGKGLDAVSTVVVLRLDPSTREAVPLARALMTAFGPVGGMLALTAVTLVAVALLAESGTVLARLLPDATPDWYAPTVRAAVYLVCAGWFALVGVHNFLLLA